MSLVDQTTTTYYSTGGLGELVPDLDEPTARSNQNEPYLDFLHYLLGLPDHELPTTLTTSYGEDEQSVPESYTNAYVKQPFETDPAAYLSLEPATSLPSLVHAEFLCFSPAETLVWGAPAKPTTEGTPRDSYPSFPQLVRS